MGKREYKIVISDCHLSAGRFFEGQINPHEDFVGDAAMVEFFEYFSNGKYGNHPDGTPVEVELILNGDYLDYLNVPIDGEFHEGITEETALLKTEIIFKGHPKVMKALRTFASQPGKKITYLIGNHDAELFFEKVRVRITKEWDPEGRFPSPVVEVVADRDRLSYPYGVEVRHGNQFEAGNAMNFDDPFVPNEDAAPILALPWGSIYVLKIINPLKWERNYVDKVRPVKFFILMGFFTDFLFTSKFVFLSLYYFAKTRLRLWGSKHGSIFNGLRILFQELKISRDLETEAREILDARSDLKTLVLGHTHRPMDHAYPDGKQYINTGTWTRMINLDWSGLGQHHRHTFAHIKIEDGESRCELREWQGAYHPHQPFQI